MKIELDIPAPTIANMMISFMCSGDPVTRGWCNEVNLIEGGEAHDNWYADPKMYEAPFAIEVVEVDEDTGDETRHMVRPDDMVIGLQRMATKYPHVFEQVIADNTDAPCADIFLQCICFGEEKYA